MRQPCFPTFVAVFVAASWGALPAAEFDGVKLAELRGTLTKFVDDQVLPGAIVAVGSKAGVAHTEIVGRRNVATGEGMTADTVFRIASMTKPITALAVLQLQEAGKLRVTDPVEQYLPEFRGQLLVKERGADGTVMLVKPPRPITLRDLLTHTSGLPGSYPEALGPFYLTRHLTLAESIYLQSQRPLEFEPGTKWAYCNAGIDTLGRIVEVVSGESFDGYLQRHIFQPLGMYDTTCFPRADQRPRLAEIYDVKEGRFVAVPRPLIGIDTSIKHPMPAGGLCSTVGDLARLYQCLLNGGELHGQRIIGTATLAEMTQPQTGDLKTGFVDGMSFGFGFAVVKEPQGITATLSAGTYGHGGAFGTQGWLDPHQDLFLIILFQRVGLPNADGSDVRAAVQRVVSGAIRRVE